MAHFAELDENNIVLRVIVVSDNDCLNENGNESEFVGAKFCSHLLGGRWIQTSYNNNIRQRFAGPGFYYDEEKNVFIGLQPFPSWVLDENNEWVAPIPRPEGYYYWDEEQQSWVQTPPNYS